MRETFDVIVVGGSFAGLSAAMYAARGRRKVLVIDAGQPRNRFAEHSHGFFGQDGRAPADILGEARAQLLAYPAVTMIEGRARRAAIAGTGFEVEMDNGEGFGATRLVLATGVRDILPDVPGLAGQWGKTVLHCPYCHGYELDNGPVGVLAVSPLSMHHALLLPEWGRTTFFTSGAFEPDAEQLTQLRQRGVRVENVPVAKVVGNADVISFQRFCPPFGSSQSFRVLNFLRINKQERKLRNRHTRHGGERCSVGRIGSVLRKGNLSGC